MRQSKTEFIILMAALIAMAALSIDAMLPALSFMADDLSLSDSNDRQLIVTTIFIGLAIGQFIYGPISDSIGRKPVIIFGLLVFLLGTVVCVYADTLWVLLSGRILQGLGAAATRNIATAIVRDGFKGDEMASVMSIIMAVFVAIPMLAPALGQLVLLVATWRVIFIALLFLAIILLIWFAWRQPETLPIEKRRRFSMGLIFHACKEVSSTKVAIVYTIIGGLVFGAFVGFLSASQQLLQEDYATGEWYVVVFASLVFAFGLAAVLNSRLVVKLGAAKMVHVSLLGLVAVTLLFVAPTYLANGKPIFAVLMVYLFFVCFATGLLMGNLSALALEPLGHIAGTASAVVGGSSTLIAVSVASVVGQNYGGNVYPFVVAFLSCGLLALLIMECVRRH